MKKSGFSWVVIVLLAIGVLASCSGDKAEQPRVLVFGIDGGTWRVIEPMMRAGELPNLERLYRHGIHGVLESAPPALSPVVWTTIFTGKPHQMHGIHDWKTSQSTHRKVAAIWEITSERGMLTYVLNVPGTWPPEDINGVMLSGFPLSGSTVGAGTGIVTRDQWIAKGELPGVYAANRREIERRAKLLRPGQWSDWFEAKIPARPNWRGLLRIRRLDEKTLYLSPCYRVDGEFDFGRPKSALEKVRRALGVPYIPEGPGWSKHAEKWTPEYLFEHLVQVSRIQSGAAALFARDPWRLFIFVDTLVDRTSHPYWAYMSPGDYHNVDPAKAERYGDVVREAYRETDRQLGRVLAAAKGKYYVVIVSDHGFHSNPNRFVAIGTHDFDGIYLISAPWLQGEEGRRARIDDVTPTILYLLGLPVGADMTGRVLPEVVAQVGRQPTQVASYEQGPRQASEVPVDRQTWEQLRALGYVDGAPPRRQGTAGRRGTGAGPGR
ncbi:MAG: hypothetical protein D6815_03315 [Candidatus Dadabacteria bacterium]|nr:MAG: hypothetical protein D6815_03315 [Candidatus Dadabacteria bacterium]